MQWCCENVFYTVRSVICTCIWVQWAIYHVMWIEHVCHYLASFKFVLVQRGNLTKPAPQAPLFGTNKGLTDQFPL